MDAIEGRSIITCDVPGTFLQGDWLKEKGKECYLKFENIILEIICQIETSHKQNVTYSKSGKKLLHWTE